MSHQTARSQAQRQAFQKEVLWPTKLTAAQVQLQTRSYHPLGGAEQGGKGHSTAYTGVPSPILTHMTTANGALSSPSLSQILHRRGKSTIPFRTLLPTPHIWWKQGARHALVQEKTGNRKRGWFGPHLPGQVSPRPPLPPSTPVPSEFPRCATVLLSAAGSWLTSTEVPRGCEEVRVGRCRGLGIEVPKAPTPGGGEGADSFVLFALRLHMPCHLSVPLLLSCHREVMSFGEQKAPVVCSMPP